MTDSNWIVTTYEVVEIGGMPVLERTVYHEYPEYWDLPEPWDQLDRSKPVYRSEDGANIFQGEFEARELDPELEIADYRECKLEQATEHMRQARLKARDERRKARECRRLARAEVRRDPKPATD